MHLRYTTPTYPTYKYADGSVIIVYSYSLDFTHVLQDHYTGNRVVLHLPWCQWSNSEKYG